MSTVQAIPDPADCTRRFVKTRASDQVTASVWEFKDLSRRTLLQQDLLVHEAESAIEKACFLFPNEGPFPNSNACEEIKKNVFAVSQKRSTLSPDRWLSVVETWSKYLNAVATELDTLARWSPCGVGGEARSLGTDVSWLFMPITLTILSVKKTPGRAYAPWLFLVSPIMMVYGAGALVCDTVTLVPSLISHEIKRSQTPHLTLPDQTIFQDFLSAADSSLKKGSGYTAAR